jgi:hypothetical protein
MFNTIYTNNSDIEVKFSTKKLPLEYKILEWRLIINRQLYEENTIDLKTFSEMEKQLLGRMTKIRNENPINNNCN